MPMPNYSYQIINLKNGFEDSIFERFPYEVLMRCCSILRYAEDYYSDFWDDYSEYITGTGERTVDLVHFSKIPITEDNKYLVSFDIVDFSKVVDFCIYINPPYGNEFENQELLLEIRDLKEENEEKDKTIKNLNKYIEILKNKLKINDDENNPCNR